MGRNNEAKEHWNKRGASNNWSTDDLKITEMGVIRHALNSKIINTSSDYMRLSAEELMAFKIPREK